MANKKGTNSVGHTMNVFRDGFYWKFFSKHKEFKDKYDKKDLYRVRDRLFGLVRETLVNQPNGVVLNGVGYFGFCCYRKRAKIGTTTLFRSKGMQYQPCFFPVYKNFKMLWFLFFWDTETKKAFKEAIDKKGVKYKVYPSHIRNLIGNGRKHIHTRNTRRIYS